MMGLMDTSENQMQRAELVQELRACGIAHSSVLKAIQAVPRHCFVPAHLQESAYLNTALPIGEGQTISQPFIVARMTELVFNSEQCQKVLEIGTGSGYQAAVLAQLYQKVYTVERIQGLLERAEDCFQRLKIQNIHRAYGDGFAGYLKEAPYDAILVTAVAAHIPTALLDQLKTGGRLVMPVENLEGRQFLTVAEKQGGGIQLSRHGEVRFVPMLGGLS